MAPIQEIERKRVQEIYLVTAFRFEVYILITG